MNRKLLILILLCFSGFTAFAQTQTPEQTETKLEILSLTQPIYNAKARRKGVKGTVRLLVTFKSDGEIGDIADVTVKDREKFEKYGLTEQEIKAAGNIKFKPATKDGQPVTVSKTVEYLFSIY